MKKIITILLMLSFTFSSVISEEAAVDYVKLAAEGSAKEIKDAVKSDDRLYTRLFGSNRENFLMLVLHNNRPYDIIKTASLCGIDVTTMSKDGRTSVMYACRYVTDPKAVKYIIKFGTVFGIGIDDRLTKKDDSGKSCFDHVKENPNYEEVYPVLTSFTDDPEVVVQKKLEKEEAKKAKAAKKAAEEAEKEEIKEEVPEVQQEEESLAEEIPPQENPVESVEESPAENTPVENNEDDVKRISSGDADKITYTVTPVIVSGDNQESQVEEDIPEKEEVPNVNPDVIIPEIPTEKEEKPAPKKTESYKSYSNTYLYDFALNTEEQIQEEEKKIFTIENPDAADKNGVTLLMKAAKAGNDWDVENLLKSGADPNLRDKDGWSALMYACRYQNSLSIINRLIDKGAHIRVRNKYNATPLLMAADYSQNPQIIKVLLKDRTITEDEVYRAFIMTVTSSQGESHVREAKMQVFLDLDIPLNRLWKGKTPLMYAAQYGSSTHVIKILMDNGAKPGIQDHEGKTAFDYAKLNSNLKHDDVYWALNSSAR
ncbi:ankyrin repeat domain-containing protein [Treponema sp.]|uniref:ankyrin repeat domain-containing protein n=1 Tax=Treponema sp. TaxID=166 RepID=UPI0025DA2E3E|nr:ankyrin repeat domain-containing protein [Treponema sp.]MCR5217771.1 ankyrin repeat domain-containing protein [Treponema sp.]